MGFQRMTLKLEKIDLELTNQCNLKCQHCYANAQVGINEKALTLKQVSRVIKEFTEAGGKRVAITGGEPLLHKNFEEIFQLAVNSGLKIELETNGTLLTSRLAKKLSSHREAIRYVQISLDGPTAAIHDKVRGVSGAFQKTTKAIKLCLQEDILVRVSTVIMKENKDSILETVNLVQELGVVQHRVDAGVSTGRGETEGITPLEYVKIVKEIYAETARVEEEKSLDATVITPNCGVGESRVAVLSNGNITPCPMIRSLIAGSAFHPGDLSQALYSRAVTAVRDGLRNSCDSCSYKKICGRGCKARALALTNDLNTPDIFRCAFFKNPI